MLLHNFLTKRISTERKAEDKENQYNTRKQNALCHFQFKFKISTLKHLHPHNSEILEFPTRYFLFSLACVYLTYIYRLLLTQQKIYTSALFQHFLRFKFNDFNITF